MTGGAAAAGGAARSVVVVGAAAPSCINAGVGVRHRAAARRVEARRRRSRLQNTGPGCLRGKCREVEGNQAVANTRLETRSPAALSAGGTCALPMSVYAQAGQDCTLKISTSYRANGIAPPMSAYTIFGCTVRSELTPEELRTKHMSASGVEYCGFAAAVSERWKRMSDEEKAPFVAKAVAMRAAKTKKLNRLPTGWVKESGNYINRTLGLVCRARPYTIERGLSKFRGLRSKELKDEEDEESDDGGDDA